MSWLDPRRGAIRLALIAAAGCAVLAACSDAGQTGQPATPAPTGAGADTIRTIEASTQMHLDGVDIGVGNIWEDEFTPTGGSPSFGLTAALFISVEDDASQNRTVRVGPGQDLEVPGYRLRVVSIEATRVRIEVSN